MFIPRVWILLSILYNHWFKIWIHPFSHICLGMIIRGFFISNAEGEANISEQIRNELETVITKNVGRTVPTTYNLAN